MNCQEVEELAGAYALWALPPETIQEIEAHLASCSAHPDIAGLRAMASGLAWAAPSKAPPRRLRARLREAIRAQPAVRRFPGWRWPRFAPQALTAGFLLAAIGLLAANLAFQLTKDGGPDVSFVRTFNDGGTASGRILYIQEEKLALISVEGLAPLPAEKVYQVWAISQDQPVGIGLFNVSESGQGLTVMEIDLSDAEAIAITVEPAGGSPQPTTAPILIAEI